MLAEGERACDKSPNGHGYDQSNTHKNTRQVKKEWWKTLTSYVAASLLPTLTKLKYSLLYDASAVIYDNINRDGVCVCMYVYLVVSLLFSMGVVGSFVWREIG